MSDEIASPSPIKFSWIIGTLAAFTIFAVIASYSSRMTRDYPSYDQQRGAERKATLAKVQADENQLLYAPADWVDQGKGIVHIPIDEATAKEVDLLKAQPVQMGSVIPGMAPPAPAAPPAQAPAVTNAAPAAPTAPGTNAAPQAPKPPTVKKTNP